jgi:hypothetical protein
MIEIGPNLKEVLLDFMDKNLQCSRVPGYLLKESFGELIEQDIKTINERKSEGSKGRVHECNIKEYPPKSGYYWFRWKPTKTYRIVYFFAEIDMFQFIGDSTTYFILDMQDWGHFVQPIIPIPEPGKRYIK